MSTYSLSHLPDQVLLRDLAALVARDRATTASLLAHLAEVDARKLYLPAAYPSMYAYCVGELGLCEQAAFKRIRAARTARQFPAILGAVADGRLHLSAVILLAPYLTPENSEELLVAAAHKNRSEIEQLLAQRFPRPDLPARLQAVSPSANLGLGQLSPETVAGLAPGTVGLQCAPSAPGRMEPPTPRPQLVPLSPQRFALQLSIGQSTHDKLRYAQSLLGHQIPSGDVAQVLDRALEALIRQLERRKFAATKRPRPQPRRWPASPRYIAADVKRTVWERDGGQCTFESETGRRCPARTRLEFDHVDPVARGGRAEAERMRLRCRAHNQYAAECTFGAGFMRRKRREGQHAPGRVEPHGPGDRQHAPGRLEARAAASKEQDVVPWLRALGLRADEARRAAALCEPIPHAPLEERVRVALSFFAKRLQGREARVMQTPT